MKNPFLFALLLVVLTIAGIAIVQFEIYNALEKETSKLKEKVGQKVIMNKDTLLIIDYSLFNNTLKLSTGQDVSFDLIEKLPIVQ